MIYREQIDELWLEIIDLIEKRYPNLVKGFDTKDTKEDKFGIALSDALGDLFDNPDYRNYN